MNPTKVPANVLSTEHFQILKDCTTRMANTDVARQSYAQILDGAPNSGTSHYTVDYHNVHDETSEEAFRVWDTFRDQFSFEMLTFDTIVLQVYQNATPRSRQFILRLLELIATACHGIAVMLFKIAKGGLRPRELKPWPQPSFVPVNMLAPETLPPTAFSYGGYVNVDAYPNGVADCAGYWAEFEIFGGVITFDRGTLGSECKSAFVHPGGDWMIAELSTKQLQDFLTFGIGESDGAEPPFPWKGERGARRVDPYKSFDLNIYRNRYERLPPGPRRRDVLRAEDFPELIQNAEAAMGRDAE